MNIASTCRGMLNADELYFLDDRINTGSNFLVKCVRCHETDRVCRIILGQDNIKYELRVLSDDTLVGLETVDLAWRYDVLGEEFID